MVENGRLWTTTASIVLTEEDDHPHTVGPVSASVGRSGPTTVRRDARIDPATWPVAEGAIVKVVPPTSDGLRFQPPSPKPLHGPPPNYSEAGELRARDGHGLRTRDGLR